ELATNVAGHGREALGDGIDDTDAKGFVPLARTTGSAGCGEPFDAANEPLPEHGHGLSIALTPDQQNGLSFRMAGDIGNAAIALSENARQHAFPRADLPGDLERRICAIGHRIGILLDIVL